MDENSEGVRTLEEDKAITLAAVAAKAWSQRRPEDAEARPALQAMMNAVAWIHRARAGGGEGGSASLAELPAWFQRPVSEWIPGGPPEPLLEYGIPTSACLHFADGAERQPLAEVEQRRIVIALENFQRRPDGDDEYRRFRRFLVEHGWAREGEVLDALMSSGLSLDSEACLLTWDDLVGGESTKGIRAMHRIQPKLITVPGVQDPVVVFHSGAALLEQA